MLIKLLSLFSIIIFYITAIGQNFVWAKKIGGGIDQRSSAVALDSKENVYTIGTFDGTTDFDPGPGTYNLTASGTVDGFISKLDLAGNLVWAKKIGGTRQTVAESVAIDDSDNLLITGWFEGTVDFDPGLGLFNMSSPGAFSDNFILKLDSSGNFVWVKSFFGNIIYGQSITLDKFGNIYTTGQFGGTIDFDPGPATYNLTSIGAIFISKLNPSGNFVWAKTFEGNSYKDVNSITTDDFGNVYTTGYFQDTIDCDPSLGFYNLVSSGNYDGFISKLDSMGNFIWAKKIGGSGYDVGHSLVIDSLKNLYIAGSFQGTVDFDPGLGIYNLISNGGFDVFLLKLDSLGNI